MSSINSGSAGLQPQQTPTNGSNSSDQQSQPTPAGSHTSASGTNNSDPADQQPQENSETLERWSAEAADEGPFSILRIPDQPEGSDIEGCEEAYKERMQRLIDAAMRSGGNNNA
ncbi:hypothetical protein VTJ49DRAFT_822 [Mycothermus thermophilus]|uniref:Uncharacterized protein n=1 Tax=Humicola insolens TaxID=85995 RepID=A0ABR3VE53_HUMIN